MATSTEKTFIVTGPQGCGKSRAADQLMKRFGCSRLVDEWHVGVPLQQGALHLTNECMRSGTYQGAQVLQFSECGEAAHAA